MPYRRFNLVAEVRDSPAAALNRAAAELATKQIVAQFLLHRTSGVPTEGAAGFELLDG
jgi:hypothetical protein